MSKPERLFQQLDHLERDYRLAFSKALTACAEGRWGLFGHNEHLHPAGTAPEVSELREMARAINKLRARIGERTFQLHEEFEAARGPVHANELGEPKKAQAWLALLKPN